MQLLAQFGETIAKPGRGIFGGLEARIEFLDDIAVDNCVRDRRRPYGLGRCNRDREHVALTSLLTNIARCTAPIETITFAGMACISGDGPAAGMVSAAALKKNQRIVEKIDEP